jgi:galactonate dehydratase
MGLYDVVMPDVKYAGGLAECLRIAELAARHGVAVSLHNPSGPVCHAHSIHLSAALQTEERLEYQHGETPLFFGIAPGLEAPRGGFAPLPAPFDIEGDAS